MSSNGSAPDRYVRIPRSLLHTVQPYHMLSSIDLSIASPQDTALDVSKDAITGHTQWGLDWQNHEMSIGWDWGVLHGLIVMINPVGIRTDIQLTENGNDVPPMLNRIHLFEWIETLPWRDCSIPKLLAEFSRK